MEKLKWLPVEPATERAYGNVFQSTIHDRWEAPTPKASTTLMEELHEARRPEPSMSLLGARDDPESSTAYRRSGAQRFAPSHC
jgi:hypothetical protein